MPLRFALIAICFLLFTCDDPVDYSPFETKVAAEMRNTTQANLERLAKIDAMPGESFKVALLSDPHYHFNDMRDALAIIDKDAGIDFIIVAGDLTENGLLNEYEIFHSMMAKSRKPYLTVIGNHDHLSNGGDIYRQMFGETNYSFSFGDVKFVMFDNVKWENNAQPDYNWFEKAFTSEESDGELTHQLVIPVSHIPPFDGQMKDDVEKYRSILSANNVKYSLHGHRHTFSHHELFSDGVEYLTVGSPQYRSFVEMTVGNGKVSFKKIDY
jgi:Icc protein